MPFISNIKAPTPIIYKLNMSNFNKGLNNVDSPFKLNDKESPNLKNVVMFEEGVVETRPGLFKYLLSQFSETINKIYLYETDSASYFICSSATKVYTFNINTDVITELCSVSNTISGTQYDQKFYFVDGANYREFDGTNLYTIESGFTDSDLAVSATVNTIVLPSRFSATDDAYNTYQISIISGTGLGQTKTISDYVGSTKTVTVDTNWSVTPDNTSIFYISQFTAGAINTNGSTKVKIYIPTYNEFADPFKGSNIITSVKTVKHITLHNNNRIVLSVHSTNKNIIYQSALSNLYYFPTNQYQPAITNNADYVIGTYSFNNALCIFKSGTIFVLYGTDETDYDMKEVTTDQGAVSINTVAKFGNDLFFLTPIGIVYKLYDVRTDVKKVMTKQMSDKIDITKEPINILDPDYANSFAIYHDTKYVLSVEGQMLVYSDVSGWLYWDNIEPTAMINYKNKLLLTNANKYICRMPLRREYVEETYVATITDVATLIDLNKGYISGGEEIEYCKVNDVDAVYEIVNNKQILMDLTENDVVTIGYLSLQCYNDNGEEYECYWESKDFDFDFPSRNKQLRKLHVTANTYTYFESLVELAVYVDSYDYNSSATIKNTIPLFGQAEFGDIFNTRNVVNVIPFQVNRRGRIFRFRLSGTAIDKPFKLYNLYSEIIVKN